MHCSWYAPPGFIELIFRDFLREKEKESSHKGSPFYFFLPVFHQLVLLYS